MNKMPNNKNKSVCEEASTYYYDYLINGELQQKGIEEHIKNCPRCQKKIQELKEIINKTSEENVNGRRSRDDETGHYYKSRAKIIKMLEAHFSYSGQQVGCRDVRAFLPTLLIQSLRIRIPTPVTAHLDNCSECRDDLDKIRKLNLNNNQLMELSEYFADEGKKSFNTPGMGSASKIAEEIENRPESGVKTVCRLKQADKDLSGAEPVNVEIIQGAKSRSENIFLPSALKATAAAAAVLVFMVVLWFNASPAGAISIEKLYDRLRGVKNAYKAKFIPGRQQPVQQEWVSRERGVIIVKNDTGVALWNFEENYSRIIKNGSKIKKSGLSDARAVSLKRTLEGALGIIPFENPSELPAGAEWKKLDNVTANAEQENYEVYELSWQENTFDAAEIEKNYRFFINRRTQLPEKVRLYRKDSNGQMKLAYYTVIEYPDTIKMNKIIEDFLKQFN